MKKALVLASFIMLFPFANAQETDRSELKEHFLDAEFFFAQEAYTDALYEYLELYSNGYQNVANINYRIGICYLNIPGQKERSIPHLLEAVKDVSSKYRESSFRQESAPTDAWLFLGNAYRVNNLLDEAIAAYTTFKEVTKTSDEIQFADQQITACKTALSYMNQPLNLRITNLGDSINGTSSNFKAVVSGDGRTMVYMNELPFYDAVYFSRYRYGGWSAPVNITPQIESDGDQYVSSVSYNGSILYLTREDPFNSDIYMSTFEGDRWTKSRPVDGQNINTKYWESHASISADGKNLYFTSNRRGGSGYMDVYVSGLGEDGIWGEPLNLGSFINTALNEDTPFITENDSLLYFSSQGHENIGGYDVFRVRLNRDGSWGTPENLGYPVNTTDDDLFYYPWYNDRIGYVSLYRDDGYGKEDIYAVQPADDMPLHELIAELLPQRPETEELAMEESRDAGAVEAASEASGTEPAGVKAETGILPDREMAETEPMEAEKEDLEAEQTLPAEVPGPSARTQIEIALSPVFFNFDDHSLTEDGKEELRKIYDLLSEFPEVQLRLSGHTDAIGQADYNLGLSKRRATSALNYLVDLGMNEKRLVAVGLGETDFAAINSNPDGTDNPEGRKLNRRVELEITGLDNNMIIIRSTFVPEDLRFKE
ncbi:MAG: OmpA family protein [Bacteroidales bacterium]|nr:OmpA family protein [Bacteroidales bacterium]